MPDVRLKIVDFADKLDTMSPYLVKKLQESYHWLMARLCLFLFCSTLSLVYCNSNHGVRIF